MAVLPLRGAAKPSGFGYYQPMSNTTISALVAELAELLLERQLLLATAESCTGGGIAQALTGLAGSSDWFDSGFVTYSNAAKQRLLQVPTGYLATDGPGAVSEEVVLAMTEGAIANSQAQLAVAVSGIAGPDGGSAAKPVGTVWIAWQWDKQASARCFHFPGDREAVRQATVVEALRGCVALLRGEAIKGGSDGKGRR
ncbi:MAG: CinA family protein [Pseudohongiellaceae bacterium]